jgi:aromatic ring-opening dioxygenase LigB subunit
LKDYIESKPSLRHIILNVGGMERTKLQNEGKRYEFFFQIGRYVRSFINSVPERVAVVISGDLAHTHKHQCTDPLYNPAR